MSYSLNFTKHALRDLEDINEPYYSAIKKAIYNLTTDPRPIGYIKLKGRNGFRIRVGNYRIIYDIFDLELLIEVIAIGHRKDIYE
jgi:mRNA interferase RelE/StbE